jgi:hypothetical protein
MIMAGGYNLLGARVLFIQVSMQNCDEDTPQDIDLWCSKHFSVSESVEAHILSVKYD